ncbi:copper amine oxidase N-terminal domain-containing protein [Allomeiothermus silvanus]|uniref:copper amine oxidase N-terminal domain-containing protein n=1 Tax=Allomeiothermus silvanus TaxID=52022 RepID=UPI0023F52041|nr:copper amine oxidase N-terminal domain-containing protein [Allomeiothermus silvanus]
MRRWLFALLLFLALAAAAGGERWALSPGLLGQGRTPYPQVFLRTAQHWLLYTYPAGPFLLGGSVVAPVRPVAELLGATVEWSRGTVTVSRGAGRVRFAVGRAEGEVNGVREAWPLAPRLLPRYNTVLAPLEPMLRAFGFSARLAKTPGGAYLLRLGGESLERVDAFIRERLYWWDVGLIADRMAGGEADNLVPTAFELNPLRPLPPEAAWARLPLAEEPLYARSVVTFREAQGRGLEPGAWGIYLAEGTGANVKHIGLTPTALPDGTTTQHPCPASGAAVLPGRAVACRFEAWRYAGTPAEQPVRRVVVRIIRYK